MALSLCELPPLYVLLGSSVSKYPRTVRRRQKIKLRLKLNDVGRNGHLSTVPLEKEIGKIRHNSVLMFSLRTRRKALLRVATKPESEDSRGRTFLKEGKEKEKEKEEKDNDDNDVISRTRVSTIRSSMGYATCNATDTPSIISVTLSRRGCRNESSMTMRLFEALPRL
ncbi:hypothetical protein EAG_00971 [Camponotus floridanus]|uniref:Uncharacterized protein n=1 Tax=Camponotus floridanus TaxID=104421 RepID=E2B258_CAMFO|nr:hypothetical protein EAG_00971 [Camponotus floridanus]